MQDIYEYINEKLHLDDKLKGAELNHQDLDESILNVKINSLEDLRNMLIEYFGDRVAKCTKISSREVSFKYGWRGIKVHEHFTIYITWKNNKNIGYKLNVGEYYNTFVMQLFIAKNNKFITSTHIMGLTMYDICNKGENFKEWIYRVKSHHDNKKIFHAINFLILFGILKLND